MVIAICGRDDDTGVCFTLATKGKDCYNHLVEERQRTDLSVGRRKPEDVHDDGRIAERSGEVCFRYGGREGYTNLPYGEYTLIKLNGECSGECSDAENQFSMKKEDAFPG